jgi:hypothetical protein
VQEKLRGLFALNAVGWFADDDDEQLTVMLDGPDEYLRAWAIRLAAEDGKLTDVTAIALRRLAASDPSPPGSVRRWAREGVAGVAQAERQRTNAKG